MRRIVTGLCASLAVVGWVVAAAAQEKTIELKFAHWVPPQHALQPTGIVPWAQAVEAASGGTVKTTIYPAQQLGKAPDHYDMVRDGIADVAFINPGYQPGRFPIIGAGELPFLITNAKAGATALDQWYRKYAEREMKEVKLCFAHLHDPGTVHAKKPITNPDQIKGMKIRPAHATMANLVTLLGGSSVQVSAPEAREALERGVADAITFPWQSIILFGIDKVVKFHMDAPFYVTTFAWVMNKDTYARMSPRQKQAVDANCNNAAVEKYTSGWADYEAKGRETLGKMDGHTLVKVSAADVAAWRKAAEPLRQQWKDQVAKAGLNGDQVLNELINELKARNAAY